MFKKDEVVIYPSHGKTIINRIIKEKGGEIYYELLYGTNLIVLIPVTKSEMLGMRYPITKTSLINLIQNSKNIEINEEEFLNVSKTINSRLVTGEVEDLIYCIKLLKSLSKFRQEKNKRLEINERQYLDKAKSLLYSEMEYVLGKNFDKKFYV